MNDSQKLVICILAVFVSHSSSIDADKEKEFNDFINSHRDQMEKWEALQDRACKGLK